MPTKINKGNRPDLEDRFPADIDRTDALLDEARRETFPASDSTAISAPKEAAMATAATTPAQSPIYGSKSAFVEQLLPAARARLITIASVAPLYEAARLLRAGTDLVVVCGTGGAMVGVITKSDVVARIGECQGAACTLAAALVMSADVLLCAPRDLVHDIWSKMKARDLKNVPIADADRRPIGVLNARDALGILLQEVKGEESQLRDYVMGVGYR
ncbi:MAG: CBS domain-containing protein [Burkholderiales bacterium]